MPKKTADNTTCRPTISQQLAARRRKKILIVLAAAVVLLLARAAYKGQSQQRLTGNDYHDYHNKTFLCIRVVDGDTIDIAARDHHGPAGRRNRTRIRLWGIDTPEVARKGRREMYFAGQASKFAIDLMLDKIVRLELIENDTRGYYGRLLAYVYLPDGRMYNRLAVEQGYAYADHRFKHPMRQKFIDLERQARRARRGLWTSVTKNDLPKWYHKSRLKDFFKSGNRTKRPLRAPNEMKRKGLQKRQ